MTRTLTVRGRLSDGKVELLEPLNAPDGVEVDVSLTLPLSGEPADAPSSSGPMDVTFGMFRKEGAAFTTEEDWQDIKKIWGPRDL